MPPALLGHIGHIKTAQDWVMPLIVWLHARPDSQQEQQRLWAQLQQQLVQHPHKQLTLSGQGLRIQLQSTPLQPELEPEPEPQSGHNHAAPHPTPRERHWGLHSLHFVAQGADPIWPGPWPAGAQPDGQAQSQSQSQSQLQNTAPTSPQQLLQRLQVDPDEALVTDDLLSCQILPPHGQPLGVTATFDSVTGQMQELILMRLGPWLPGQSVSGQSAPSQSGGQA
jgi:hypothetical protein